MAAFTELDWRRLDVRAIVESSGLAVVEMEQWPAYQEWLEQEGYRIETLDFTDGLRLAIPALGQMLDWQGQFGYAMGPDSRNLNALEDGFEFAVLAKSGCVLQVIGAELAWREDSRWLLGFLSIAQAHSRKHLALGERFFIMLVLPEHSPLIGVVIEEVRIPGASSRLKPEGGSV